MEWKKNRYRYRVGLKYYICFYKMHIYFEKLNIAPILLSYGKGYNCKLLWKQDDRVYLETDKPPMFLERRR